MDHKTGCLQLVFIHVVQSTFTTTFIPPPYLVLLNGCPTRCVCRSATFGTTRRQCYPSRTAYGAAEQQRRSTVCEILSGYPSKPRFVSILACSLFTAHGRATT